MERVIKLSATPRFDSIVNEIAPNPSILSPQEEKCIDMWENWEKTCHFNIQDRLDLPNPPDMPPAGTKCHQKAMSAIRHIDDMRNDYGGYTGGSKH